MNRPYLPYAGIGSRITPSDICLKMFTAAQTLEKLGFTLRSGGAPGADTAFEMGVKDPDMKEIYLPWPGFNDNQSTLNEVYNDAMRFTAPYHPNWYGLTKPVQKLMARNAYQVMGYSLKEPALFVLCWTHQGKGEGGTGQAIRIARAHDIPVFDMGGMELEEISKQILTIRERV